MPTLLKFPHPYKAWLTISNDPDFTNIEAWQELNQFIFKELNLNWANSIFLYSYNQNLTNQVNLNDNPEIASQPTDTIHTWGDFVHAGEKGFSRNDALKGIELLKKHNITPHIWVDHSRFTGNLIHINNWGSKPKHIDSSGNTYEVFEYTLDLINALGIKYIWDGTLTQYLGQDRKVQLFDSLHDLKFHQKIKYLLVKGHSHISEFWTKKHYKKNKVLFKHTFPDGTISYLFSRYGNWRDADIVGLSNVISEKNVQKLIRNEGIMLAYTHLGKTNPSFKSQNHIPPKTKNCFKYIRDEVEAKRLLFSSPSFLFDYLVIRDNIEIKGNRINFKSDGIRYQKLTYNDLVPFIFSFSISKKEEQLIFELDSEPLTPLVEEVEGGILNIKFQK